MTDLAGYPAKAAGWKFPAQLSVFRKLYVQVLIAVAVGVLLGVAYNTFWNAQARRTR